MVTAAIKIPGYSIRERIYVGTRTIVYQAVRERDQAPVAIKLMRNPDPSFDEIVYFRNQYTIAANLDVPGIVQPYSLEIYGNGYVLIMEFGGISLRDWLVSTQLSIPHFLSIAIQITTVLDQLHRNGVIHKDIKPANILINPHTQQIKITDFSISSLLLREPQQLQRNILEGTLAYISPEQTGRINRGIDFKSDFYSLGVTFYELLTKQLPFISNEPSELVHRHITKQPVAVDAINKNIPSSLAVIISKLMAKNPEERYQSALGLKYDLEACLNLYHSNEGASNTIFPLGTKDICDRFLIPNKLYGRDKEVTALLEAFARVSTTGVEILLLRGFSGTGKTALVKEVQKPITQNHGYFIKGKYDQFARNVPLFGIIQAFGDLIEQLLTQSESQILKWKNLILNAVGDNGQVIIDVIPSVELLIGKQPPSTELDVTAAQNRFNLILFNDNQYGVENSILAQQYAGAIAGTYYSALIPFYSCLCQLGIYSTQTAEEQQTILTQVKQNQDKIKNWANHAPMNHLHKWYLIEAEQHRVLNNKVEAIECYDKAIALAQENGYINEEALCWELAAKFYLVWGKKIIAQTYMLKAYEAYQHWGARTKLTHLKQNYPELLTSLQSTISPLKTDKFATISSHSTTATEYLDFKAVLKASQSLSSEIQLDNLVSALMQVVLENAGADKGVLLLLKNNILGVAAHSHGDTNIQPENLINYARYAKKSVIINDVGASTEFTDDIYFEQFHPQSVLCTPIINKTRLVGVLYLENNLIREAFTTDRVEILNLLCSQAAISLENATLYQTSQNYAIKLEQNLQEQKIQALELQQTLDSLQEAQTQLVQSEKMSALGNLVAGVAHEINNPVGFIAGNIQPAVNFVNDIFGLLDLYEQKFPDPGAEINEEIETIDLDYIRQDLPKLLSSMKEGVQRIRSISNSLRTFSRADTETKIPFDIHDGINSTIMILSHRLKANENRPQIEIVKNYAKLPQILCFPGQLNQVLMNLFANAIDAMEELNTERSFEEIQLNPNCITIRTSLSTDAQKIIIYIKDNGKGMTEEVKQRIFDNLFTTKAVGKGTGLGLTIVRQIIIQKHGGNIKVNSTPGEGAEFIIEIPVG